MPVPILVKASAFFFCKKLASCMKCINLYSVLVTSSSRWWSPIGHYDRKHFVLQTNWPNISLKLV